MSDPMKKVPDPESGTSPMQKKLAWNLFLVSVPESIESLEDAVRILGSKLVYLDTKNVVLSCIIIYFFRCMFLVKMGFTYFLSKNPNPPGFNFFFKGVSWFFRIFDKKK